MYAERAWWPSLVAPRFDVALDPLAVLETFSAVVSDGVAADFISSRLIRRCQAPFLQGPDGAERSSPATPALAGRSTPANQLVLLPTALSVLPVLPEDLGDDVNDQHVHQYADADERHQQAKCL